MLLALSISGLWIEKGKKHTQTHERAHSREESNAERGREMDGEINETKENKKLDGELV